MPISIKSRREKSATVRVELRDFKAGKGGNGGINWKSQTLRLLEP